MTRLNSCNLAAQYVRVSSEHQRYSIDRQLDCIQQHAGRYGFTIVKTYIDRARSGLSLRNRSGLKQLLADVMGGQAGYRVILVYDVSRWGRFQDVDEAGHYEFICRQSGIPVHYCAEPFEDDGSSVTALMKALKRTMAAEYSRELGDRSFAGQKRITQLGFKAGGAPGYGYRRVLVSPDRQPKQALALHERKSLATDRVLLAPGPADEVACVRRIYRMLVERQMSFSSIARELNKRRVPHPTSTPWTHYRVSAILTNLKYTGAIVYGRTSKRLQTPQVQMPRESWVVVPGAFTPLIDEATYAAAQRTLGARTTRKTNGQLLVELRSVLGKHGRVTAQLIHNTQGASSPGTYRLRFGSLARAYQLIGYQMPIAPNIQTRCSVQKARRRLIEELHTLFPQRISIGQGGLFCSRIQMDRGTTVHVLSCARFSTEGGKTRWRIRSRKSNDRFIRLLALMGPGNENVERLVLLPPMELPPTIDVSANSRLIGSGHAVCNLGAFLESLATLERTDPTLSVKSDPKSLRAPMPPKARNQV
jgi:DNA invertase Pin-like site-specific DNA recombinase